MSNIVTIKSHPTGITLLLNKDADFETLVREVCQKFADSRSFFGAMEMTLSIEGRDLDLQEVAVIIEAIELNSDIHILLYVEANGYQEVEVEALKRRLTLEKIFDHATIVKKSVVNKDEIVSDNSIVIIGDVKKYATVRAKGNIIILGQLQGNAIAGEGSENEGFIVAGEVKTDTVTIGSVTGEVVVRRRGLHLSKQTKEAILIRVWQGEILAEPLSGGLLKHS